MGINHQCHKIEQERENVMKKKSREALWLDSFSLSTTTRTFVPENSKTKIRTPQLSIQVSELTRNEDIEYLFLLAKEKAEVHYEEKLVIDTSILPKNRFAKNNRSLATRSFMISRFQEMLLGLLIYLQDLFNINMDAEPNGQYLFISILQYQKPFSVLKNFEVAIKHIYNDNIAKPILITMKLSVSYLYLNQQSI